MNNTKELIQELEKCNTWITSLKGLDESLFFEPIKEGKWSIAEIVSHLTFWDQYIWNETLPKMKLDADFTSIDIETLNEEAAAYATSGVSMEQLLDSQVQTRNKLVTELKEKTEEAFFATFTLNGEKIDEYSGYPHTMFNYFASFAWHDNHHKKQIDEFLAKKEITI